jgi:hypothetical protein
MALDRIVLASASGRAADAVAECDRSQPGNTVYHPNREDQADPPKVPYAMRREAVDKGNDRQVREHYEWQP